MADEEKTLKDEAIDEQADTGTDQEEAEEQDNKPNKNEEQPEEKQFSQEEVNDIVQKRLNRERRSWDEKLKKDQEEAEKLKSMDDAEKKDYEIEKLRKEIEGYKRADSKRKMTRQVQSSLSDRGVEVSENMASLLVADDAETTRENITRFAEIYKADLQAGLTRALSGKTPKQGKPNKPTREEIDEIKDPTERISAIARNLDLYND